MKTTGRIITCVAAFGLAAACSKKAPEVAAPPEEVKGEEIWNLPPTYSSAGSINSDAQGLATLPEAPLFSDGASRQSLKTGSKAGTKSAIRLRARTPEVARASDLMRRGSYVRPLEIPDDDNDVSTLDDAHVDLAITDGITGLGFAGERVAKVPVRNQMGEDFGNGIVTTGARSQGMLDTTSRLYPNDFVKMADSGVFPLETEVVITEGSSGFGSGTFNVETEVAIVRSVSDQLLPVAAR